MVDLLSVEWLSETIGGGISAGSEWLVNLILDHGQPVLGAISGAVDGLGGALDGMLLGVPPWVLALVLGATAWWRVGWRFALFTLLAVGAIFVMGLWEPTVSTLGLVLASTVLSLAAGIPLGILMARSRIADGVGKTLLDLMQTMPAFVYLIPAVLFFGLGRVPGIIATVVFAMPPAVRLTALGIRQVPAELVEAGRAFGCRDHQLLLKVQLPNALPSIMAGVNQTMMMALSMIVVASMIGAGGLGNVVLQGIQRLDIGLGVQSGLSVVLLAVVLDRITQSFGRTARSRSPASPRRRLLPWGR
ncbi:ABC transporter permease [Azospirillum picis]|uniref:Glycine betaine/proline transport system permease protein n=1 Tax=Azospirillum picis TaxID=488438 RepID=A0ABU0MMD2_9PROT|nr:proline/glycine betaine ABC transporter permease [Azospirillum picis]MBP2300976.1 glycine betaine/proline transport system permease protein [Azospirillum picis]MDQ0534404.1 glycine betaine/proline transport system permease protein [Azospirillum picis]